MCFIFIFDRILTIDSQKDNNKNTKSFIFDVFEFFLFSKSGALIAENVQNRNIYNSQYYKEIFPKLVILTTSLDKKTNRTINHNIFFFKERKIVTVNLSSSNIIALGVCSNKTKTKILFFFLLKIIMAFINYMEIHSCKTSYNIHSIVFETFLLSPIKSHFSLATKEVFRRYTLYINNTIYKNSYLLDLTSDEIIISLESLYEQNTYGEVERKIPNKLLWEEVVFHSHQLKNDYIKKNNNIFIIDNLQDFYVKLEIKATYPRLIYIIKFLPLLGGMTLIQEYSQFKLSRFEKTTTKTSYKEYEIEYGYHFDEQDNFVALNSDEPLLNEPEVLRTHYFYITECLFCNLNNLNFFIFKKYSKIYFSDEIIKIINKQIYSNIKISQITEISKDKNRVHQLLEKIENNLYEEYMKIKINKNEYKESAMIMNQGNDESSFNKSFYLYYPNSLLISKQFTLENLFKSGQLSQFINPDDISLDLSSEEDDPIFNNLNKLLKKKKEINKLTDPDNFTKYYFANAESKQLIDLLNDNLSISENELLLKTGNNKKTQKTRIENIDLPSHNITELSSLKNNI